jgi:4-nitrophenyl phosphatase
MIKAIVFDLDGVLYYGENVVEGAVEAVADLRNSGYQIFYLTNNSGKSRQQIVDKLNKFGFSVELRNTYCGSYALVIYLIENKILSVYVIGTEDLKRDLKSRNIGVEDSSDVSAVVVGFDRSLNYDKIAMASDAIRNGAKLIIANKDTSYPIGSSRRLPGTGAMVGAIVGATDHDPDFHVGKPNTYLLELLCKEHGLSAEEICVVGDELSDIELAINFRCQGLLFDPEDAFPAFSEHRVKKLCEIASLLKKRGD